MAEALAQVKTSMGSDAIILHTRTFHTRQWLGLKRREMVEITAGQGIGIAEHADVRSRIPAGFAARPRHIRAITVAAGRLCGVRPLPKARPPPTTAASFWKRPRAPAPRCSASRAEMSALKQMVKDLVTQTRQKQAPNVPTELFDYYMQLVGNQVDEELASSLIQSLRFRSVRSIFPSRRMSKPKLLEQVQN